MRILNNVVVILLTTIMDVVMVGLRILFFPITIWAMANFSLDVILGDTKYTQFKKEYIKKTWK